MITEKFDKVAKMVKSKREPVTPRRRASFSQKGAMGKVTKVLSRPVSSTAPCVAPASTVKVLVRVRPPNEKEQGDNFRNVIKVIDDQILVFDPKEDEEPFFFHGVQQRSRDLLKKANKDIKFVFDRVFNNASTNSEVFTSSTKSLIDTLMDGYNCSVFAYGATGAGKTFTMIGSTDCPGITYLTMKELFQKKDELSADREFELMLTYIEVYNELVKDLLNPGAPLNLREDARYGVVIPGVKGHKINNPEELFSLLEQGNRRRTQHPTDSNAESSRSHAVFQVYLQMTMKGTREVRKAKLSMIDLAGSERGSATGFVGARFKEGANINKSLLALGNCINSLAEGKGHVPYRDSKLTRLLKDSLGGNCHTIMIANISPSSLSFDDTYNTLRYATRATKIKSNIKRNIVSVDTCIDQYIKLVEDLRVENSNLKSENTKFKKDMELLQAQVQELSCKLLEKEIDQEHADMNMEPKRAETKLNTTFDRLDQLGLDKQQKAADSTTENTEIKSYINTLYNEVYLGMKDGVFEHTENQKDPVEMLEQIIKVFRETAPRSSTPLKEYQSPAPVRSPVSAQLRKLFEEKKELLAREFQLQSSELGMSLRRQLKTETKRRLSNFYVTTPDKNDVHQKLHDQLERYEKKEKAAVLSKEGIRESRSKVESKIGELLRLWPELQEEHDRAKLEIDVLEYQQKCELKNKEVEILLDDHNDKCTVIENMADLLKPLFLAVGGKADAPESVKRKYENLVAMFQGRKNIKWQDSGVSLPSSSGIGSSTSLHQSTSEETTRATKRKIETDSQVSLDSTFLMTEKGAKTGRHVATQKTLDGGDKPPAAKVNPRIVAKGFKSPAKKRLAPSRGISPHPRISPRSKENKHFVRKVPVTPDTAKALINAKKSTVKPFYERPRF